MAQYKKKPVNKKKNSKKRKNKKQAESQKLTMHLSGTLGLLLAITAIGKFGIVGAFLANVVRLLVGDTYQVFLAFSLLMLIGMAVYGKFPTLKKNYYWGVGLIYGGMILIGSIRLFNHINIHHAYLNYIIKFIQQDINNGLVKTPVGGGGLGATLLTLIYPVLSNWGAWLLAIAALVAGVIITFNLPIKAVLTSFFGATEYAANVMEDTTRSAVEASAKKMSTLNQTYQAQRGKIADELFERDFEVKSDSPKDADIQSDATVDNVQAQNVASVEPEAIDDDNPFTVGQHTHQPLNPDEAMTSTFVMPEIVVPNSTNESETVQTIVAPGFDGHARAVDPSTGEILSDANQASSTAQSTDTTGNPFGTSQWTADDFETEMDWPNDWNQSMESTPTDHTEPQAASENPERAIDEQADAMFLANKTTDSMKDDVQVNHWSEKPDEMDLTASAASNTLKDDAHGEAISHVDLIRDARQHQHSQHQTQAESYHSTPEMTVDLNGFNQQVQDENYQLPPVSLLTKTGSADQSKEQSQLAEKSRVLQQTLESFNIKATVEKVVLGPTITQYEIKPAVGVKVSKITNLADDLAMALAAKSLRIEAPIPGKSLVGIEVANEQQATVGFRNMYETVGVNRKNLLEVPIGKSVAGDIVKMDLTKMPHLLIAGSTGSGKSVAINTILASMLLQAKPSEVRLMLVDPKKVELSIYNDVPHLITPVVSEPRKAAAALKKVVAEMDHRFDQLSEMGVRNIDGYNKAIREHNQQNPDTQLMQMPYLVVIIDELADLMMTVSGEVEPAIVRIAQLGRAAGIHLIVATQRPSVDVITGLIKANVPSRMAFAVGSGTDSRTILDSNGAEKLLGRGDMLFKPIGENNGERVQGAFMSDDDVENLTNYIRQQGAAQYDESMEVTDADLKAMDSDNGSSGDTSSALDEIWDDALDFASIEGEVSASMMQRHFRIGYNRAARLVDDMEDQGILGTATGGKRRPVLMSKEQWYAKQQH